LDIGSRYETAEHKTHNSNRYVGLAGSGLGGQNRPLQTKIFSHQCGGRLQPVGGLNPPNPPDKSNAGCTINTHL